MKYIELKAVMKLVQEEREQFRNMLKELGVQSSIKDQIALRHFRNILRQLTVWTEKAKDEMGPIAAGTDHVYVLYSYGGAILGATKNYKKAKEAQQVLEKKYPDMEVLISRADLLDLRFEKGGVI